MNEQTLERLMIDDSLGALPPDVSELLAAYCADKGHEQQRQQWERLALIRAKPFSRECRRRFRSSRSAMRVCDFSAGAMVFSAAAALLFGIGIGFYLHAAQPSAGPAVISQVTSPPPVVPTAGGVSDIWSSNRLVAAALESKHADQPQWRWSSPVTQPQIGGMQ